jgi:hypothetical protein
MACLITGYMDGVFESGLGWRFLSVFAFCFSLALEHTRSGWRKKSKVSPVVIKSSGIFRSRSRFELGLMVQLSVCCSPCSYVCQTSTGRQREGGHHGLVFRKLQLCLGYIKAVTSKCYTISSKYKYSTTHVLWYHHQYPAIPSIFILRSTSPPSTPD